MFEGTEKKKTDFLAGFLVVFFVFLFVIAILHFRSKAPDTDFWGYRLPVQEAMYLGGQGTAQGTSQGIGQGIQKALLGGACSLPDLRIEFPKPNLLAYAKLISMLLFCITLIYGMFFDGIGYIIFSFVWMILFVSYTWFIQDMTILEKMNLPNILLFSENYPMAKWPALLGYFMFYTTFMRMTQRQVTDKEMTTFIILFLFTAGYGMYTIKYNSTSELLFWLVMISVLCTYIGLAGSSAVDLAKQAADKTEESTGISTGISTSVDKVVYKT
jgi:hypothetical protein